MPEAACLKAVRNKARRWTGMLLSLFLCGMLFIGCDIPAETPVTTTSAQSTAVSPTPVPVSGTLRVWTTPFSAPLNPLTDPDRTHQAIFKLVYQGLFRLSEDQSAIGELCISWTLSPDGYSYTIQLEKGIVFHDGTVLDATDVESSFLAVKAAGPTSPYASSLSNISTMTVLSESQVRFDLIQPDTFTPWALVFPILPSEFFATPTFPGIPPGTGPYRFVDATAGTDLLLTKSDQYKGSESYLVQQIRLVALPDIRSAIKALQEDLVDVIDLTADEYTVYRFRQDLNVQHYAGSRYLFFTIQASAGKLLSERDAFLTVKNILEHVAASDTESTWDLTTAAVPAVPWSVQLDRHDASAVRSPAPSAGYQWSSSQHINLLYPEDDPLRKKIAEQAEALLVAAGLRVVLIGADRDTFSARMAAKAYDILLSEATVPPIPDPSWLYVPGSVRAIPGLELLPRSSGMQEQFTSTAAVLSDLLSAGTPVQDWGVFYKTLLDCAGYSPYVGIGFRQEGLIAGHRIKGQFTSKIDHQYNGIEEVWVWSGS